MGRRLPLRYRKRASPLRPSRCPPARGFPALMISDTRASRCPHYRTAWDTPDKLDYARMARVVAGLEGVIDPLTLRK